MVLMYLLPRVEQRQMHGGGLRFKEKACLPLLGHSASLKETPHAKIPTS